MKGRKNGEEVRMGTYSNVGLEEESAAFVLFIALFSSSHVTAGKGGSSVLNA